MPRDQQTCYHPELYPTRWEEKRPEPCLMLMSCQCGENQFCPICRFGFGAYPCSCSRAHGTIQVKIN